MKKVVIGESTTCPKCGSMLEMNIDVGDNYLHDVCLGCGFKRKKNSDGELVDKVGNVTKPE